MDKLTGIELLISLVKTVKNVQITRTCTRMLKHFNVNIQLCLLVYFNVFKVKLTFLESACIVQVKMYFLQILRQHFTGFVA